MYLRLVSGDEDARGQLLELAEAMSSSPTPPPPEQAYYVGLAADPERFPNAPGTSTKLAAQMYRQAMVSEPAAGYNLAMLALGSGTPLQPGENVRGLIEAAANAGMVDAMVLLGYFLKDGAPGFEKSTAMAVTWFERAEQFDRNPLAELELAKLLREEDPVRHATRIVELLISSANQGMAEAAAELSNISNEPVARARWALLAGRLDGQFSAGAQRLLQTLDRRKVQTVWDDVAAWQAAHRQRPILVSRIGKPIDLVQKALEK